MKFSKSSFYTPFEQTVIAGIEKKGIRGQCHHSFCGLSFGKMTKHTRNITKTKRKLIEILFECDHCLCLFSSLFPSIFIQNDVLKWAFHQRQFAVWFPLHPIEYRRLMYIKNTLSNPHTSSQLEVFCSINGFNVFSRSLFNRSNNSIWPNRETNWEKKNS